MSLVQLNQRRLHTTLFMSLDNLAMFNLKMYLFCFIFLLELPIRLNTEMQLNPNVNPFQRSFIAEIRRVEEMRRHVRFFSSQIAKEKDVVPIRSLFESDLLLTVGPCAAQTIDDLDTTLAENEERLNKMNESYQTFSERTRELIEARHVLRETAIFFDRVRSSLDNIGRHQ